MLDTVKPEDNPSGAVFASEESSGDSFEYSYSFVLTSGQDDTDEFTLNEVGLRLVPGSGEACYPTKVENRSNCCVNNRL